MFGQCSDFVRTGCVLKPRLFSCYNALAVTRKAFGIAPEYLEPESRPMQRCIGRLTFLDWEVYEMSKENEKMELCLCRRCLEAFYRTHRYKIYRVDPYEVVREPCVYCQVGTGYDFVIVPKYHKRPQRATTQSNLIYQ